MGLLIFFLFGLLSFAFGRERDSPYPYSLSLSPSLTFEWGLDYSEGAVEARVTYAPGPGSEGGDLVESGAITGMQYVPCLEDISTQTQLWWWRGTFQ